MEKERYIKDVMKRKTLILKICRNVRIQSNNLRMEKETINGEWKVERKELCYLL